jgi:hypothetical protein
MDPRAGLEEMVSHRDSNSDRLVIQPVASLYNDWAIPALTNPGMALHFISVLKIKLTE